MHENCDKDPYKILVGNKSDLELKIELKEIQVTYLGPKSAWKRFGFVLNLVNSKSTPL